MVWVLGREEKARWEAGEAGRETVGGEREGSTEKAKSEEDPHTSFEHAGSRAYVAGLMLSWRGRINEIV